MRDIFIIIFIIIAIFGGGIYTESYLNKTADEISRKLENLKKQTIIAKETQNREQIKKEMKEIEKKWDETSEVWSIIVVHQEIDNIENALVKSKSNIENGELEDALQEIETASFFINHVKEREKVCLKNIF